MKAKIYELQESRVAAVAEMRSLHDLAETEKRDLRPEEDRRFKELETEIEALDARIGRVQSLEARERSAPAIVHSDNRGDGRFEVRARDFSLVKAIRAAMGPELGGQVDIGFEREISAEVVRRSGRTFQGVPVPQQVFEQRTLLADSTAEPLIPNVHRGDLFIERLRSALVTERAGATVLNDLVGIVDVPRQTGSSVAQWVPEDGSLTETDAAFDDITLSPHTVGALTSYSRRTLISASPSIEQIVRSDLAAVIANAIDLAALTGDGSANTPIGIINTPGVARIAAGASEWDSVLDFIAAVENANVVPGSLAWVLNAYAARKLRATPKILGGGGAGFVMDEPGMLAGYPAFVTSALPGAPGAATPPPDPVPATVIYGDFSSLLIASFGPGVDILVNPYETTAYVKGRVLVRALRDVDVGVRHPEGFSFATDVGV